MKRKVTAQRKTGIPWVTTYKVQDDITDVVTGMGVECEKCNASQPVDLAGTFGQAVTDVEEFANVHKKCGN